MNISIQTKAAYSELAKVPRKSYLGKYQRLTPDQERWIRALLCHWGSTYGKNDDCARLSGGGGMWARMMTGWTEEQQERIAKVLDNLRERGYYGKELFIKAAAVLWPKKSLSDLLEGAGDEEEAEFMERIILESFQKKGMIYAVGRNYYTSSAPLTQLARNLQYSYAPHLTEKQCIDRVRWCLSIFNSAVYHTLKKEFADKVQENDVKVCK